MLMQLTTDLIDGDIKNGFNKRFGVVLVVA